MNCPDCDREVHGVVCTCGWIKPGSSKVIWRNTEHEQPTNGVTKEQFGLGLYETVCLIGGIMQVRNALGHVAMGDMEPGDYKQREGKLIEQFRTALLALKADEVTQVARRYPWVAAL